MTFLLILGTIAQESTEETFRKIEESIEKANTLSVTFLCVGPEGFRCTGTLLLKEGGCFNFAAHTRRGVREEDVTRICDGTRISSRNGEGDITLSDVPKVQRGSAAPVFARLGAFMGSELAGYPGLHPEEDIKKVFAIKDVREGEDDQDAKTLLYSIRLLRAPPQIGDIDVKLWYEPKSYKILKRVIGLSKQNIVGTFVENYSEVIFNKSIPDNKFKIKASKGN